MRRLTVLTAALLLLSISIAWADPATLADLQQTWKQGDYDGVVKRCTDALAPGGVTDPEDRFKVAWLKAEAQLRLRRADAAADAFNAAVKETQDARQQSLATATAILIGRSKDFIYTSLTIKPPPKVVAAKPAANPPVNADMSTSKPGATTKPALVPPVILPRGQFDIIVPVNRTDAMAAMWTDERLDATETIKAKIAMKTLPAINNALERVNTAAPIAVAAGAADWPQTQKDLLSNAARVAANTAMKAMNLQLIDMTKEQARRRRGQHPKSMPQGERDQLNQMTQALDQITTALKALPEALNVDKDTYSSQLDNAASLEDRATTVLATD
jgi:hypothetical protein